MPTQHLRSSFQVVIPVDGTIPALELSNFLYYLNLSYISALKLAENKPEFPLLLQEDKRKAVEYLTEFIYVSKTSHHPPSFRNNIFADQELLVKAFSMNSPMEFNFDAISWAIAAAILIAGIEITYEKGKLKVVIRKPFSEIVKNWKYIFNRKPRK